MALIVIGCVEYDFERHVPERLSFGTETYRVLRKDAARSARVHEQRAAMLDAQYPRFVRAVDTIFPEDDLSRLNAFLLAILPLYDEGIMGGTTRRLAELLGEVAADETLRGVWAAAGLRDERSYRHMDMHPALLEQAVRFEPLSELLNVAAGWVLNHDGLGRDGQIDPAESTRVQAAQRYLRDRLLDQTLSADPERFSAKCVDFLLDSDADLGTAEGRWVVRLDPRGGPRVASDGAGAPLAPAVDLDGDGRADQNAEGAFLNAQGEPWQVAPFADGSDPADGPRDSLGRALNAEGYVLYDTVDLSQTVGAYLLGISGEALSERLLFELAEGAEALLPARVTQTDENGRLQRVYPPDPMVLDLTWAWLQAGLGEHSDELLDTVGVLLGDHRDLAAQFLLAFEHLSASADRYPEAVLLPGNHLTEDLVALFAQMSEDPGLIRDLLRVFHDPVIQSLVPAMVDLLSYKSPSAKPAKNGPYETCYQSQCAGLPLGTVPLYHCLQQCPAGEIYTELVDQSQPGVPGNRSFFERMGELFYAVNGVSYALEIRELSLLGSDYVSTPLPPMVVFEDASVALVESVLGRLILAEHVTDEALADPVLGLLLETMGGLCDPGFVDALLLSLITELELHLPEFCATWAVAVADSSLTPEELKRQQYAAMMVLLAYYAGTPLSLHPSPDQLIRYFNTADPKITLTGISMRLSPMIDKDGYEIQEHNGDLMYALERSGFINGLEPIFRVFSDYGRPALPIQLMETLYLHWMLPGTETYRKNGTPMLHPNSGLVRYEALFLDWLQTNHQDLDGDGLPDVGLFPALAALAQRSPTMVSQRGRPVTTILSEAAGHLLRFDPAVTHRDGSNTSLHPAGSLVSPINRYYVLRDALEALDTRMDAQPEAREKLEQAFDWFEERMLGLIETSVGQAVFEEPGGVTLARLLVERLAAEVAAQRDAGELAVWVNDGLSEVEAILTGRGLPLAFDLLDIVTSSPEEEALWVSAATHLLNDAVGRRELLLAMYNVWIQQMDEASWVASQPFVARWVDPDRTWMVASGSASLLSQLMRLLHEMNAHDVDQLIPQIVRAAVTREAGISAESGDPAGAYPLDVLGEVYRQYRREDPLAIYPLRTEDYRWIMGETQAWLLDDERGMEKMFRLVDSRVRTEAP